MPKLETNPAKQLPDADAYWNDEVIVGTLDDTPDDQPLTPSERKRLWEMFQQIGRHWSNVYKDSAGQRSSWLEFINLRCAPRETNRDKHKPLQPPGYLRKYRDAIKVLDALVEATNLEQGFQSFLNHQPPRDQEKKIVLKTRLDFAKFFVVDEFIKMQIVAGGFRGFGSDEFGRNRRKLRARNYNGFVRGSRYNRLQRVRAFREDEQGEA